MRGIRRKEKEITETAEMIAILKQAKYITVAMCLDDEPYLVTLSHGFDVENNCIYFHCAQEGKKIDILKKSNLVWGQALKDDGYATGKCDHLYATTQFKGRVTFITDENEKRHALRVMIDQLEEKPDEVYSEQVTDKSVKRVGIGRIDIEGMSGKRASEVIIQT
jgi:nitroimidazol reductase NimA-like FMN-containing flavoprotein (pyridoxamine 5'-phosphate oxidase superfamily)